MAPIKRKIQPPNEAVSGSSKHSLSEKRPTKRPRQGSIAQETTGEKPSSLSISGITTARSEGTPFPRGGASLLTPLEFKQVQLDATRDVLFEQQNKVRELGLDASISSPDTSLRARKKKNRNLKSTRSKEPLVDDHEQGVKIESLSYKRLHRGALVLGQVSQINAHDIALSLPNNLTGFVPVTSISSRLTERLEKITDESADEVTGDGNNQEEIDLHDIFSVGQFFRAYVVSTGENKASESGKKRIELSLIPQQANDGITKEELVQHSMIMASIISVEDHGLVMDLGLKNSDARGFITSDELGADIALSNAEEGAVLFCRIISVSPNGKVIKLSTNVHQSQDRGKLASLAEAPSINSFLPGTAVEFLLTELTSRGIIGTIMGMINVTADLIHSGLVSSTEEDLKEKHKVGTKVKARIICTFPNSEPKKLGISLLDHIIYLTPQQVLRDGVKKYPLDVLPLSSFVEESEIKRVFPDMGLLMETTIGEIPGFVHISRVSDRRIEVLSELSGPYKVGSHHRSRVIAYNGIDGLYLLSLEQRILDQPFLRIEDVQISDVVNGTIEKLIVNARGVGGVLVNLAEGISGLVPEIHLADVSLLHPEKKFKPGMKVNARVLAVDFNKKQIRLTLKKTLLNSELPVMKSYTDVKPGMQSLGTIVSIVPGGAVVQFYGEVRGFLPVSEMSEAYIQDPKQHFRIGQVVNVYVLKIDRDALKMTVSCKDPSTFGSSQQNAFRKVQVGSLVAATVSQKSNEVISLELEDSSIPAILTVGHLADGSDAKTAAILKRIRVGQVLRSLLVLDKVEERRLIILTNKPSLLKAAENGTLPLHFEDVTEDKVVHGFVKNITQTGVFVQFGQGLTGLLPKSKLPEESLDRPDFGLRPQQSLTVRIYSLDQTQRRFWLSMLDKGPTPANLNETRPAADSWVISNPVDTEIETLNDLAYGKSTFARIVSIKETQLNVQIAENIQGRVDVSQIYDSWEEIKDRKHPLRCFASKQIIPVKVIGIHDSRNHRFLPITHRVGKNPVFELSAKPSDQNRAEPEVITLEKVRQGSSWIAFVNNVGDDHLWVNLSPNVRGRIQALDISDDVSILNDLETHYPIGSAIKVRVLGVDLDRNRLDLSGRISQTSKPLSLGDLSKNIIVPGKVTKVNDRHVMVQLSETLSAPVHLTDLADDFSEANPHKYSKNDVIRVCVTDVDVPNKRIRLTTRSSKILSSSLPVQDPEITSVSDLKVNDIVRGFVKNVADNGLFINLGGDVTAYVRVSDISDSYLKDWKTLFQVDQLVKGKVIVSDEALKRVQLSLKSSVVDQDYVPPITFQDLANGQIIAGTIRKVEDYGVFIVVDGSANVSGLCHKSEMAEGGVSQVRSLYGEGDKVKAKVLNVDVEKKRISFGLKPSYFDTNSEDEDAASESEDDTAVLQTSNERNRLLSSDEGAPQGARAEGNDHALDHEHENVDAEDKDRTISDSGDQTEGLNPGGFDWRSGALDTISQHYQHSSDSEGENNSKDVRKRSRKPVIRVDRTGDLDTIPPQSADDFERHLLSQPDASLLWIEYMAFQTKLGELANARNIAERAIRTINIHEETEKLNVWIALLNLENVYGTDESVEDVFKRACQYNDAQEIHERLISIYIQSQKHTKADNLFQSLIKQFSQSPNVWYNYAHFLHHTLSAPERARPLLPRAIQSLPSHTHLNLTVKFAALEFHSPSGSPERGRTIFEGLLSTYARRIDLWNQLLDLEIQQDDKDIVRDLFERGIKVKGLRPKAAKAWFKRWKEWEEKSGNLDNAKRVQAKAEEWVQASIENAANDAR